MIPNFDPLITLRENWQIGADIPFALWELAGHEHREEIRDGESSAHRSAALRWMRTRELMEALSQGQMVALAIAANDESATVVRIPEATFDASDLQIEDEGAAIAGLGRRYLDVRICRSNATRVVVAGPRPKRGRPDQLGMLLHAWRELKSDISSFLELPKTRQNLELREKVAALYPGRFPGNNRPGESTIRKHRRENPECFN